MSNFHLSFLWLRKVGVAPASAFKPNGCTEQSRRDWPLSHVLIELFVPQTLCGLCCSARTNMPGDALSFCHPRWELMDLWCCSAESDSCPFKYCLPTQMGNSPCRVWGRDLPWFYLEMPPDEMEMNQEQALVRRLYSTTALGSPPQILSMHGRQGWGLSTVVHTFISKQNEGLQTCHENRTPLCHFHWFPLSTTESLCLVLCVSHIRPNWDPRLLVTALPQQWLHRCKWSVSHTWRNCCRLYKHPADVKRELIFHPW